MIVIWLSLLGALILLDKYAIGEFGISQPIIAGAIIGALYGDIKTGIYVGALFQMIFLANLPIGRDVPPDAQAAGIAGCGSYFVFRHMSQLEPNLIIVLLIGILAAVYGSFLDILARRINEQAYYRFLRNKSCLFLCHFSGIVTSFFRGVALFLPLFTVVSLMQFGIFTYKFDTELLMILLIALGIANGIYLFFRKKSIYFLIIGSLCALAYFVF